ncbi:hypothetical protein JXA32_10540 [Candidatus Sumerlaeota bacterium]|nr:hypothetical protein [Candidatus Sumerlaeota bacterium]
MSASDHHLQQTETPARTPSRQKRLAWLIPILAWAMFIAGLAIRFGGDFSKFIIAGDQFCDRASTPANLHVYNDFAGYDGQFYYRMSLAPFNFAPIAHGIRMDDICYRSQRWLYPLIVYCASLGHERAVPAMMILVDITAVGIIALLFSRLLESHQYPPLWAAGLSLYPGLLISLSRDLTEAVAAAFLLGGCYFFCLKRYKTSSALLLCAVFTRETAALLPGIWCAQKIAGRMIPITDKQSTGADFPFYLAAIPVLGAMVSHVAVIHASGSMSVHGAAGENETIPFVGFYILSFPFSGIYASLSNSVHDLLQAERFFSKQGLFCAINIIQLAAMTLFFGFTAWIAMWNIRGRLSLWALPALAYLTLNVCLMDYVWNDPSAYLRSATEAYLLGSLLALMAAERRALMTISLLTSINWLCWCVIMLI